MHDLLAAAGQLRRRCVNDLMWNRVQTVAWVAIWASVALVIALLIFGPIGPDEDVLTPPAPPCRLDRPGVCPAVTP